jgi:predicted transcriptional regulator
MKLKDIKAKDVMTKPVVCVNLKTSTEELSRLFIEKSISGTPVVDEKGKLIGVVSKTDILETHLLPEEYRESPTLSPGYVENIMVPIVSSVAEEDSIDQVIKLMVEENIRRVVVTDPEQRVVGIITPMDILKFIVKKSEG